MVKDAEANKEADRRFHELVDVRNKADNLIHSATKSLTDLGAEVQLTMSVKPLKKSSKN